MWIIELEPGKFVQRGMMYPVCTTTKIEEIATFETKSEAFEVMLFIKRMHMQDDKDPFPQSRRVEYNPASVGYVHVDDINNDSSAWSWSITTDSNNVTHTVDEGVAYEFDSDKLQLSLYTKEIVRVDIFDDHVDVITKLTSEFDGYEPKVYKQTFSCKDGAFHTSKKIFGKIIPAQDEQYKFE